MPLIGKDRVLKLINTSKTIANDDLRGVYFAGLSAMIKQTPVDEGRARNNWFLTVGKPSNSTTTAVSHGGSGSISEVFSMPIDVLNNKIFFTNNLPYITTLEFGGYPQPGTDRTIGGMSSQVAPDGWVRKTLIAMGNKIRNL